MILRRNLLLLLLLLFPSISYGSSGLIFRSDCFSIPNPETGKTLCMQTVPTYALFVWDGTTWVSISSGGGGSVTTFSAGNLSPLFTTNVATATSTPALTFTLSNAANDTIYSNITGGSAPPSFNNTSTVIDHIAGSTQGMVLYRNATTWVGIAPGTSGQFLQTQGAAANPVWATPATVNNVRVCTVIIGDPGAASGVLADDNDSPVACPNNFGVDWTVTSVGCWADAGSPTVTPILTGGSGTSVLSSALTCGTASWAAGTVNGSPLVKTFTGGATCSVTPCSVDVNITSAGGVAKYIVVKIAGTL